MHILAGNHLGDTQVENCIKIGEVKKNQNRPPTGAPRHKLLTVEVNLHAFWTSIHTRWKWSASTLVILLPVSNGQKNA